MRIRRLLRFALAVAFAALGAGTLALVGSPTVVAGGETFVVDTSSDHPDSDPGNCVCLAAGGGCTLRAAIEEANACGGAQTISFEGPMWITPSSPLPPLTDAGTVIDGSDRWVTEDGHEIPGVALNGDGGAFDGLQIRGSNCAVHGIGIVNFGGNGVHLYDGAQQNTVGGVGTHQRNIISANGQNGVRIWGTTTTSNTVVGNYIGTNPAGFHGEWWEGNGWHGASIWHGGDNVVRDNLVADSGWSGVAIDAVTSGTVRDNRIGMNVLGEPLGNVFYGVHVANGAAPSVSFNEIAFNARGVHVEGGSDPWIYHNTIYSNTASALASPWGGGIMLTGAGTHGLVNYNEILSNTARFGGGIAVANGASTPIHHNTIQANRARMSAGDPFGGGGVYVYHAAAGILHNDILSNTVLAEPGTHPAVRGGGVCLDDVSSATVEGNQIRGNLVEGNRGGGGGVYVYGGNATIRHNTILDNGSYTWSYGGGGVEIANAPAAPSTQVEANWIAHNQVAFGGALHIQFSSDVGLTNNVVVRNQSDGLYVLNSTEGIEVINNTVGFNTGSGIALHEAAVTVYNSILVSNTRYGIESREGTCVLSAHHNDVWGNDLGASTFEIPFFLQEDPLFFDAGADRYALRGGSPCIDAAMPLLPGSYNGLSRPQGAGHDIGAYEMALVHLPLALRSFEP